jgi:hypothetical protein
MEVLIAKLIKIKDEITSSDDGDDNYDECLHVLNSLIQEVQQSRKRRWSDHQISATSSSVGTTSYDTLMKVAQELMEELTTKSDDIVDDNHVENVDEDTKKLSGTSATTASVLPVSVQEYKHRLEKYSKELYKNPPVMPPPPIVVAQTPTGSNLPRPPHRDTNTQRLTFYMPYEEYQNTKTPKSKDTVVTDFHPNLTPDEVLEGGAFGGTYFRDIHSAVTNTNYIGQHVIQDTLAPEWIARYDAKFIATKLTSSSYRIAMNKYKAKCGGSLGMWEVCFVNEDMNTL